MSSQKFNHDITHSACNTKENSKKVSHSVFNDVIDYNSKSNKKLNKISKKISSESVLLTMIKLIVENRNQIDLNESVLSINSENLDLVQKLNYCMEYFAHIPFSFHYNKVNSKVMLDFFHLKKEIDLITNLEI